VLFDGTFGKERKINRYRSICFAKVAKDQVMKKINWLFLKLSFTESLVELISLKVRRPKEVPAVQD
jgi:hypothetical protein